MTGSKQSDSGLGFPCIQPLPRTTSSFQHIPGTPSVLFFEPTLPLKPATIALQISHLAFQVHTIFHHCNLHHPIVFTILILLQQSWESTSSFPSPSCSNQMVSNIYFKTYPSQSLSFLYSWAWAWSSSASAASFSSFLGRNKWGPKMDLMPV